MPELRPESWGHPGDQGEQRTLGEPARFVPFGSQGKRVPGHRVSVRKGCFEFHHTYFFIMTTVLTLHVVS